MHKKLVASYATESNALEMLIAFDCTETRENIAHQDNHIPEWAYSYEVIVKRVEFIFGGKTTSMIEFRDLTDKQKRIAFSIAEEQASELYNK